MKMFGDPKKQRKFERLCGKLVMYSVLLAVPYWFLRLMLWLGEKYIIPAIMRVLEYGSDNVWVVLLGVIAVVILTGVIEMSITYKE